MPESPVVQQYGNRQVISVGDRGKLRLLTKHSMVSTTNHQVKIYTDAEWNAVGATAAPIQSLAATSLGDTDGTIEADIPAGCFPAPGYYIARAYVEFSGNLPVLGDPVRFYVQKGSS